ncbi:MAG: PilZ domain-containing protein, partial [Magnetospirillum sp.]|nr:PilZ domain-containing protein [Magnetospirillum sp.]
SNHRAGDRVRITLAMLNDLTDQVDATITIKVASDAVLRAEFLPTTKLMHYIISHLSTISGSQPAYFR